MSSTSQLGIQLSRCAGPEIVIALGDGVGAANLLDDGRSIGELLRAGVPADTRLTVVLGWSPTAPHGIDPNAFHGIVTLMPGWGVRSLLPHAATTAIPTSLAAVPALLTSHLRPHALITRMTRRGDGLQFCTEVSWQQALVDVGVPVWAVLDDDAPSACAGPPVPVDRVTVIGCAGDAPANAPERPTEGLHEALADRVLHLIPEGARLQYGPGQLGTAVLQRSTKALAVDTGLLTDAVMDLQRRGLLIGEPSATYLFGSTELYRWADGRPILRGIEHSHDLTRLSRGTPFVAVNTAIEIDPFGQVNVEGVGEKVVGGIGGHPDYCTAARLNRGGLSIIAVPTRFNGRSTLVEQLSRPASTPAHDVEVIVTESGHVDLRSAGWAQRRRLIEGLFHRAA
ncbi:acetyl-CoA hydrolase/transferase C-terminal domain-containing protein [Mycolicibacterium sp. 120266]|uniref:acetyl-CoA hydrolase/transferase C-terminal domain-containing protein n=1 Tax=Mycolicibacterium sp. 120266 TaxID=3090601 RepID=UPI00299F058B|nr:acetyl-CoA hydrolase/transferase C-terminal domain-containing protein [Mycolicibacterium sp. 120266]MDX1875097.1 acetyl-CoA hydrolase/transferase C-terminal domain-containing protein [Mycolicibacterium sp. 120266]